MLESLFGVPFDRLLLVLVSTVGVFATVITYTRIAGLRSFSKMSSFDFAMTVAVGSLVATVAVAQVPLLEGMTALAVLYLLQVAHQARPPALVTHIYACQRLPGPS